MRRRRERGFVLLTALLTLAALALLGMRAISLAQVSAATVSLREASAQAEVAADSAVDRAVFDLLASDANRRPMTGEYDIDLPGARAHVSWRDLGGHINPNLASPRLLKALLLLLGADEPNAARITDALLAARAPQPAGAVGGPIDEIGALASLPGMSPDLLALLAPRLSPWWPGAPDPAIADPTVRRALVAAGEDELAAAMHPQGRVVRIEARARLAGGRTATRRAVVQLGLGLDGRSWHVLAWSAPGA